MMSHKVANVYRQLNSPVSTQALMLTLLAIGVSNAEYFAIADVKGAFLYAMLLPSEHRHSGGHREEERGRTLYGLGSLRPLFTPARKTSGTVLKLAASGPSSSSENAPAKAAPKGDCSQDVRGRSKQRPKRVKPVQCPATFPPLNALQDVAPMLPNRQERATNIRQMHRRVSRQRRC